MTSPVRHTDRDFFALNPGRRYRLRRKRDDERIHGRPVRGKHVIVYLTEGNQRIREAVNVSWSAELDRVVDIADDVSLAALWDLLHSGAPLTMREWARRTLETQRNAA